MKLIISTLFTALLAVSGIAQSVYEPFENWDTIPYHTPKGWFTSNVYSVFASNPITVTRCDTAYQGKYALRITSVKNQLNGNAFAGWAFNGSIDSAFQPTFGQPFTQKPTNMNFRYQYYPVNDDTAGGYVILTRFNSLTNKRDTLGSGGMSVEDYTPFYSLVSVPITYLPGNQVPDTVIIAFFSGIHKDSGSLLLIDHVEFKGNLTGLADVFYPEAAPVFPNPARGVVTLPETLLGADITDACGKKVGFASSQNMDFSALPAGAYFIRKTGLAPQKLLKY